MTPCSFIWRLDDIFWPKRSGIICYERQDIIWHQPPNLAPWENSHLLKEPEKICLYTTSFCDSQVPCDSQVRPFVCGKLGVEYYTH